MIGGAIWLVLLIPLCIVGALNELDIIDVREWRWIP